MDTELIMQAPDAETRQAQWLADVRDSLFCSRSLQSNLQIALRYLNGYQPREAAEAACLQTISGLLGGLKEKYERLQPGQKQLACLYDLQPEVSAHETLAAALKAWQAATAGLNSLVMDLIIRLFRPQPVPDDGEQTSAPVWEEPEPSPGLKHRLRDLALVELMLGKTTVSAPPRWLIIDQNTTCNFKCKMCLVHAEGAKCIPCHFSASAGIRGILPLADRITLGGTGEPLLHPDLSQLLAGKTRGTQVTMNTNGSLLHRRYQQVSLVDELDVSFDGANPETFEALRLGGSFEKTVRNIRFIRERYPAKVITLNIVVSRLNLDELHGIAAIADSLGIAYVCLNPIFADRTLQFLRLRRPDYPCFLEQVRKIKGDFNSRVAVMNNILEADFTEEPAASRDKGDILRRLQALKTPPARALHLDELATRLRAAESYAWLPAELAQHAACAPPAGPLAPDEAEAARMQKLLSRELKRTERLALPYCYAPWLICYVNANAMLKPCCFYNLEDSICDQTAAEAWNSRPWVSLRESMVTGKCLPPACRQCTSSMRYWLKSHLLELAGNYGFKYSEKTNELKFENAVLPGTFDLNRLMNL